MPDAVSSLSNEIDENKALYSAGRRREKDERSLDPYTQTGDEPLVTDAVEYTYGKRCFA
ncbi:MAG: hypothetical protein SH809_11200 [Rhodothermales bacterium]|nr:hypothetical protein [Rhodothermales bacterium]